MSINKKKSFFNFRKRGVLELSIAIALSIILILFIRFYKTTKSEELPIVEKEKDTVVYMPEKVYGIIIDSLNVHEDVVKPNQNLSEILTGYNVDYPTIDKIARECKDVFDVRHIRAGNKYTVICKEDPRDSIEKTLYFIYDKSSTEYVLYDLRDTVNVEIGHKKINKTMKTTSGVITSSLWKTMVDNEIDPELALFLSEIYAWTIDFYGIQKYDKFRVLYEELSVDDDYIGIGNIFGAWFEHMGKEFYAVYFEQDSLGDYYDDEGNSLRRTFLKAPLRFTRISSRFSYSRLHPILKYRRPHLGVDYAAPRGTPVRSVGDGVVMKASYNGGAGNMVKIRHNGTYSTGYMHLWKFGKGIKAGVHVEQGDIIGYVGSTGLSTGPHLDFRFYKNNAPVNPLDVESPPAKPVDSAHIEQYNMVKDSIINILDTIHLPKIKGDTLVETEKPV